MHGGSKMIGFGRRFVLWANKVCMYCGEIYGTVDGKYDSHGACPRADCQAKLKKDMS